MKATKIKIRYKPCYCGGWIKSVFQKKKVHSENAYRYKTARWQTVNCYVMQLTRVIG